MQYIGNIVEDETVNVFFTTNDGNGAAVAPSTAFEAADIAIYKDNSATQKATTNGMTMTSPFDAITGLHLITIDTSNDTGDAGFWVTGSDYTVILNPDETVDGQTIVAVLAQFSIENKYMRGTDSAALASVATEARLSELDAANIPADVDAILLDTAEIGAAGAGLTAINLPDQTMNITGNLSGSVGSVTGNINTAAGTIQTLDALDTAQDTQHGTTQTAISNLNDPTAAAIADAVWDEPKADHTTSTTFGDLATDLDAVLADTADMQPKLGTPAGLSISADIAENQTDLNTILADTNELQGDWANGGRLDLIIDELTTQGDTNESKIDTIDTNVDALIINVPDIISLANINAQVDSAFTTQMADSVSTDGVIATREQALYMVLQMLTEFAISGTTYTVKKVDGSTTLMTFTLDDGTNPTSLTRTT